MKKNRMLRWVSAASCALLCAAANATERFSDDAEAFKTYAEVRGKIEQIQSLKEEFNDVDKVREFLEKKLTNPRIRGQIREILSLSEPDILSKAKGLGFHADEKVNDLRTYIHEKSPLVFAYLLSSSLYTMSYDFAIQHRDVFSTLDTENAARIQSTANTWITEIQAKATAEIEEIGNVIYALFLEKNLQIKQHMKATRIIDSFKMVDADFHGQLNAHFYSIVNQERPIVPFAAERLIIYREIADKLFRKKDEA